MERKHNNGASTHSSDRNRSNTQTGNMRDRQENMQPQRSNERSSGQDRRNPSEKGMHQSNDNRKSK